MRAVVIRDWCETRDLRAVEAAPPECGRDEVRIRVRAVPVSFALSLLIGGRYQRRPTLPFVPGNTAAGEIVECGPAVRRLRVGDRVLAALEHGALAEFAVAPAANVYPIPPTTSFAEATTFNTSYNSVLAALTWRHLLDLQPGQDMLVLGAAGGVGTAAVELGKHLGARVIAAASSPAKRDWAVAHGAADALDSDPDGLRRAVLEHTGGVGVHAALDPVGGPAFDAALRCLRPEGRIVPIGFASGVIPQIPANYLLVRNIAVCGLYMGYYKIDQRDAHEARMRGLFETLGAWHAGGHIRPAVSRTFPLDAVAEAFDCVLDRQHLGHVVVTP